MIYITGDTHADWMGRLNFNAFPEGKTLTKNDYVIICGDFGIWHDSKEERYKLDWLDSRPFTTLFLDGNHENFDRLKSMQVSEWKCGKVHYIRPSVIHLMRGQVFDIEDLKFFVFGGASSHDIKDGILDLTDSDYDIKKKILDADPYALYRVNHLSWWKEELPSKEEMREGLYNLQKHNNEVDYILSHSPHSEIINQIGWGLYNIDVLTNYLSRVRTKIKFKKHIFGHMHIDENFPWEKAMGIYKQILRVV